MGRCFNVVCSSCHASLSVSAGASAKQVKRKCGKPNHVGRATDTPNPLRSSISFHGPGHQNAGGELDVLNSVYLISSPVVKHPVFVQQPDSSTDEVQLAPKPCFRISNNLAYPETTDANMVNSAVNKTCFLQLYRSAYGMSYRFRLRLQVSEIN